MKKNRKIIVSLMLIISLMGFSQTSEQLKMIEKAKKMQDSLSNTDMFKEMLKFDSQSESEQQKTLEKIMKMQDNTMDTAIIQELLQKNEQEESEKKLNTEEEKINLKKKTSYASSKPKINNYPFGSLDVNIMVIPLGMKTPIKIGTMAKSGDINFDFPKELSNLPQEIKQSESSKLWNTLFSQCDKGSNMVTEADNIFSFDTGALSLWTSEDRYVGVVLAVSDPNLLPWIEDPDQMEPIMGSYFELIYVAKPFQYQGSCSETGMLDESNAQISYNYNLNLKAGFNFIEYRIEHISKPNSNGTASFPDKVSVTSVSGIPKSQWIGQYF
ncbi:hypothetical protein [Yeosuana marina]|uniref:hypothetical protein n=1 Tax=Yeosuana marina TaxID=1565536 RepID=UPI0030EE3460|tara:strand:+ start:6537 stop:7517 length:981 start_codon:yes stop_codon:yes gene_type:complete